LRWLLRLLGSLTLLRLRLLGTLLLLITLLLLTSLLLLLALLLLLLRRLLGVLLLITLLLLTSLLLLLALLWLLLLLLLLRRLLGVLLLITLLLLASLLLLLALLWLLLLLLLRRRLLGTLLLLLLASLLLLALLWLLLLLLLGLLLALLLPLWLLFARLRALLLCGWGLLLALLLPAFFLRTVLLRVCRGHQPESQKQCSGTGGRNHSHCHRLRSQLMLHADFQSATGHAGARPSGQMQNLLLGVQLIFPVTRGSPQSLRKSKRRSACLKYPRKQGRTMRQTVITIFKWTSLPLLLLASLFTRYVVGYELLANLVFCAGAVVGVQRALQMKHYFWAAGFVAIAVVFSPFLLLTKIFLLMALTFTTTCLTWLSAYRTHPVRRMLPRFGRRVAAVPMFALLLAIPFAGRAQTTALTPAQTIEPLDVKGKLYFHVKHTVGPSAILGAAAYAAVLQEADAPEEWKQGGEAYGKRLGTMVAWTGIHSALAFGLDSTLHQDPRYFRASGKGFWRRSGHALRGTVLTRTDSGGETISTWRIGSDYGSAVLSNLWYPSRLNTARLGFIQGTATLGFDLLGNLASEFWPDVKKKILRRN